VVKNNEGNVREYYSGHIDKYDSFRPESILNSFYRYGKRYYGQTEIAEDTVKVVFGELGDKSIFALANATYVDEFTGDLYFRVRHGTERNNQRVILRNNLTYGYLKSIRGKLDNFYAEVVYNEVKDKYGRPIRIKDGEPCFHIYFAIAVFYPYRPAVFILNFVINNFGVKII